MADKLGKPVMLHSRLHRYKNYYGLLLGKIVKCIHVIIFANPILF
jgi:hypothetical protein